MQVVRAGLWGMGGLFGLLLLYVVAGLAGGAVPANRGWLETPGGIQVGIETNGIHTGIVLPASGHGTDWGALIRPEHLSDRRFAGRYLAFGWGERRFYLETPTWAELRLSTVAAAALGSDRTLIHVDHLQTLRPTLWRRVVRVSQAEHDAIVRQIRERLSLDAAGQAQPIRGYGPADVFYEAVGRYDLVTTCNSWVGETLRNAGLPSGAWTPFSWSVMEQALPARSWRLRPPSPMSDVVSPGSTASSARGR